MLLTVGDHELWVESESGQGTPVLLISGADSPCSHWPDALIEGLSEDGVIRFDHRDIGRSARSDSPYGLDDLVADAVGVMDALGVRRAHVVGSSMGGMFGQKLALSHPERVSTLTLLITSPDPLRLELSAADSSWEEAITSLLLAPPPRTAAERADRSVAIARLYAGSRYRFDEEATRTTALAELGLGWPDESGHGLAISATAPWLDQLPDIAVPTLIVHGDSDPLFGVDHAEAMAAAIPAAELVLLRGLGHEVTLGLVEELLPVLRAHLTAVKRGSGS